MAQSRKPYGVLLGITFGLFCLVLSGCVALGFWYSRAAQVTVPELIFPTRPPSSLPSTFPTSLIENLTPSPVSAPGGKIVYVCQIFKLQAQDQICIINADGSGQRRLTTQDNTRYFYPSLGPDGNGVYFSSNLDGNFKLYELSLDGPLTALGDTVGIAPEVSPDGKLVTFANNNGQQDMIWVMNRDGSNRHLLYAPAWDPTWSPDGSQILFATTIDKKPQLAVIGLDGNGFKQITNLPSLRGRSDWSPDGAHIVTYSGDSWKRELYLMNSDGSDLHQITPTGGNSQGPSFSPDGEWVAFTAYFGSIGNNNGCEIYIMRIDGSELTRLTENSFCDWQPRWGL